MPILGGVLLVPWGVDWPYTLALVLLWAIGGVSSAGLLIVYACCAYASRASMWNTDELRWTVSRARIPLDRWLRRTAAILGFVVAPWFAGHPYLSGVLASAFVLSAGIPDVSLEEMETETGRPRRLGRVIYWTLTWALRLIGLCLSILGRILFAPVLWTAGIVGTVFTRWSNRRLARRLRSALDVPAGAVYFVYAEQHQFDRYLGPGGLLHSAASGVIARNWRDDIRDGLSVRSKSPLGEAERTLLRRFQISNMRDDLPFVVVIAADDRLHAFNLSKPYRMRRRDNGAALRDIENRLRLFIAVAD